ncbi:F-box/FBD/LRR-repeat protein At1g13570-like isoform X2 [Lycium barbarum]|uniref:F-box/FBD/LRR-repeat protein At1g13570-like isoform X2 n=1 Tax=Lycium barbarum TaxID=112863 RepID=UPI00293E1997|nr:F-box/FBD/LRR-repeat protein At1g13570-like isoform X2 [Lycium barbarum]
MTQDGERVAVEGDREDRISDLPRNVIDRILELLPVQDAARTSILSRKWRYIWAMLPSLVLDVYLYLGLRRKSRSNFKEAVDDILLMHMGNIVKFVLDAYVLDDSEACFSSYDKSAVIDRWVLYVTRNGVKELALCMSDDNTYRLPPSIFNCLTLTQLMLSYCVFKPPNSLVGFQNLITLALSKITFVPTTSFCVIKAPRLASLTLIGCHGTQYLNIVSPGLESLDIYDSFYYILLNCFMNCKNLRVVRVGIDGVVSYPEHNEKSTLEKLLVSVPALELLSKDIVPNGLPFTLNCLWHLVLTVDFDKLGPICCALQLIKNSPNLSKLEIWVHVISDEVEAVLKYLDTPSCLERTLDKLEYVAISDFKSSKVELSFVKLLLSRTPSLRRMCIVQRTDIDIDIALELMRFPRASPRAELFYSQHKFLALDMDV